MKYRKIETRVDRRVSVFLIFFERQIHTLYCVYLEITTLFSCCILSALIFHTLDWTFTRSQGLFFRYFSWTVCELVWPLCEVRLLEVLEVWLLEVLEACEVRLLEVFEVWLLGLLEVCEVRLLEVLEVWPLEVWLLEVWLLEVCEVRLLEVLEVWPLEVRLLLEVWCLDVWFLIMGGWNMLGI